MKDDYEPIYSEDLVWRCFEVAEQYIPLGDLKLALERRLWPESVHLGSIRAGVVGAAGAGLSDRYAAPPDRRGPQPSVSLLIGPA